jgi:hypothetical protein
VRCWSPDTPRGTARTGRGPAAGEACSLRGAARGGGTSRGSAGPCEANGAPDPSLRIGGAKTTMFWRPPIYHDRTCVSTIGGPSSGAQGARGRVAGPDLRRAGPSRRSAPAPGPLWDVRLAAESDSRCWPDAKPRSADEADLRIEAKPSSSSSSSSVCCCGAPGPSLRRKKLTRAASWCTARWAPVFELDAPLVVSVGRRAVLGSGRALIARRRDSPDRSHARGAP